MHWDSIYKTWGQSKLYLENCGQVVTYQNVTPVSMDVWSPTFLHTCSGAGKFFRQEGSGACQHPNLCIVAYIYLRIYRGWQEVTGETRDLKTAITRARSNIFWRGKDLLLAFFLVKRARVLASTQIYCRLHLLAGAPSFGLQRCYFFPASGRLYNVLICPIP